MSNSIDDLITRSELAAYLKVSKSQLEKQYSQHPEAHPPVIKIGRSVRYKMRDVNAWLDAQTTNKKEATQ